MQVALMPPFCARRSTTRYTIPQLRTLYRNSAKPFRDAGSHPILRGVEWEGSPMRPALAAIPILVFLSYGGGLRAAETDLEVILAADVSRSIDDAEFELQRKGYAAALSLSLIHI